MARVRIVKIPKALSGLEVKMTPGLYGTNGNKQFSFNNHLESGKISQRPIEARQTLEPVDREDANLEAEAGETAVVNVDGIPAHFKIGGKRHSQGGTPLNLPDNSFIFSDTAKMKIKDPMILAQFGMAPKKGGYTPAEISKKYDINKYRKTLADPNSEDLDRKTAEMMISNYNLKLAKLALAQESIKGFPQGIPVIAMPYIESMEIDPSTFLPDQAQGQLEEGAQPDAEMGTSRYGSQVISQWDTRKFGGLATAGNGKEIYSDTGANIMKKLDAQDPGGPLGIPVDKDLSNDPSIGPYYRKYLEALKSNNPAVMKAAAKTIGDADIEYSLSWWPGSKQGKLSKLSFDLLKTGTELERANAPKQTTEEDLDINLRKTASDAFTRAYNLKRKAAETNNPDLEIYFDDVLKDLHKLHPDYKQAGMFRKKQSAKQEINSQKGEFYSPAQPAIYYTEKEGNRLNELSAKIAEFEEKMKAPKKVDKKAAPTKPSVDTYFPSDEELIKMSDAEVAKWDAIYTKTHPTAKKKEGGELDQYGGDEKGSQVPANETPSQRKARLLKEGKTTKGTSKSTSGQPGVKLTPEEEEIRRKHAETAPEKYVSDEEYAELEALYKKAQASSQGNPNKKTAETLAFQKRYHELLPDEARRIIASEKDPTNKGKTLGHGEKYDLAANEDMMFGKRTEQYWQAVKKKPAEEKKLPPAAKKEAAPAERKPFETNTPKSTGQRPYAPWWLQDIVKTTGAAADLMRVKKYLPWQATPEVRLPDATFYDPTRELAANTEQANLAYQYATAFADPRNVSGIQGKALSNAADIMAKYNNMNVQIANQLDSERTGIMNQASQNKANLDTQLFDKYTVANQQFDNAKNMARQNLRQSYIDAITNRAKTQALNTLYPNYYTNPVTGGFVQFKGDPNKIAATQPHDDAELEAIQKVMNKFPGTSFADASKYVRGDKSGTNTGNDVDAGYLKSQGYSGQ